VQGHVQVAAELGELRDVVGDVGEALGREAAGKPTQDDVLTARQGRAEADAGRQKVESTTYRHPALVGWKDAGDHPAERGLAGTVAADDREHRALVDAEGHVP
jgi:hypothetical protein